MCSLYIYIKSIKSMEHNNLQSTTPRVDVRFYAMCVYQCGGVGNFRI